MKGCLHQKQSSSTLEVSALVSRNTPKQPKPANFSQVVSPFQAIVDYEKKNKIPKDWINFAISRSAPNGSWQRLERGEIKLDDDFFKGFKADLENPKLWEEFHRTGFQAGKKRLKDLANPTQLGDPVSLKAETANSKPTNHDRGAQSSDSTAQKSSPPKRLKDLAKENPTMLGDPVSLKAEAADSEPTDQDRGAQPSSSASTPSPQDSHKQNPPKKLKDLAKENPTLLGDPVSLKAESTYSNPTDQDLGASSSPPSPTTTSIPPLPQIDASTLFWAMMTISRTPDPHLFPALRKLSSSQKFILGALSNTVTFPPSHPFSKDHFAPPASSAQASASAGSAALEPADRKTLREFFDVFVASSVVGLRKPDRRIYALVVGELDAFDKRRGGEGVRAGEVLFLDDIGENCRVGREVGMRTLRVRLGETERAVRELEGIVGMELREDGGVGRSKL